MTTLDDLQAEHQARGEPWLEFLREGSVRAGFYVLEPGAWDHQTPHDEDEMYYVVSGRAVFQAGAERRAVGAGSVIFVAKHQEHRFSDIEERLRVLVFFAAPGGFS
jgi:mannose-6-phosphate isomerase-like protein (cupin superfamily)